MGLLGLTSLVQDSIVTHKATMAELGLKKKEIDAIEFAFDVYDFKGDGKVDAFYAGDLIRACNLNPTLKTINEIGGGQAKGAKFLGKADIFPMYKACKDSKDQGGFHDFVEILKLYDKNGDDTMIGNELFRLLTNLSWRGCALLRSKFLPVLSDLYCTILYCTLHYSTIQYCTVQSSNGTLHSCPEQPLGSLCRQNCNCPSIFVAVKLCLTFVLVSVFIVYRV